MRTIALLAALAAAACDSAPRIVATTVLGDTSDRQGPYRVLTEVHDPDGVGSVWLHLQAGESQEVYPQMEEVRPRIYEARIPGQPAFTLVRYFVEAADRGQHAFDPPDAVRGGASYGFWVLGPSCATDLDCGGGESCEPSGRCRQRQGSCATDADCGKARRCGPLGTCLLAVRPCVQDEGCVAGEVCDKRLGQCIPRPRCDALLSCPLDFACDAATKLCVRACLGAGECGPGETCKAGNCSGAKACATDAGCGAGLTCDPLLRYCRPRGADPCAPCTHDSDCGGATDFCLLLAKGQHCGQDCSNRPCPQGFVCKTSLHPAQCAPADGACPTK
jgi:hypothetical protein